MSSLPREPVRSKEALIWHGRVRAAVTSGQARLRICHGEPLLTDRVVWQVVAGDATIVPHATMVDAHTSGYVLDKILGAAFCALGSVALGALVLRVRRRTRQSRRLDVEV